MAGEKSRYYHISTAGDPRQHIRSRKTWKSFTMITDRGSAQQVETEFRSGGFAAFKKGLTAINASFSNVYATQKNGTSGALAAYENTDLWRVYLPTPIFLRCRYDQSKQLTRLSASIWTAVTSVNTTATRISVTLYSTGAFFFYDNRIPQKFTGTGNAADLTAYPATNCGISCAWKNRLWALDSAGNLSWTPPNEPTVWPAYNTTRVPDDLSVRTPIAMVPWGDELVIFFEDAITTVFEAGIRLFGQVTRTGRGARAYRAVVPSELGILFMDYDGVFSYNSGTINRMASPEDFSYFDTSQDNFSKSCMAYYRRKRQIWCAYPLSGSSNNNAVRIFDLTRGLTWKDYSTNNTTYGYNSMIETAGEGDTGVLRALTGANMIILDSGLVEGSSDFKWFLGNGQVDMEEPTVFKCLKRIKIHCTGTGTANVRWRAEDYVDNAGTVAFNSQTVTLPNTGLNKTIDIIVPNNGDWGWSFDWGISTNASSSMKVYDVVFEYESVLAGHKNNY